MGHKGVSKRKPGKPKSSPLAGRPADGTVISAIQASENKPSKATDTGKASPFNKGGEKPSSGSKNNLRKG